MAKAIAYGRVSTAGQVASGLGLDAQRTACEVWSKREGLNLAAWLQDEGVSGAKGLEDRPALLDAIDQLGRGDVLLVAKRDRLGRDPILVALLERLVAKKGARVASAAGEGTEGDDPASVLMRRMIDAFSEYERLLIGARTKAALARKRARGEVSGTVPFGKRATADGLLVDDEGEQAVIAAVLAARARGLSQRKIVAELKARGLVSPRSTKALGLSQVNRILKRAAA
ncbi:MAG: recombinase family protein [Planctomycetes bacterium]|nr:recombinase family protein [Planctomycetota bacterium]